MLRYWPLSNVGIAMGGLGSDAAIETADVVIQTDQPSKVAEAIKVGKLTRRIVWQNISLAFGCETAGTDFGSRWTGYTLGSCFRRCWCSTDCYHECRKDTENDKIKEYGRKSLSG